MRTSRLLVGPGVVAALVGAVALAFPPPVPVVPDKAVRKTIVERTEKLAGAVAKLRKASVRDPALADIEIYHKAAVWILKHDEFFHKEAANWTLDVLDRGLLRASQQARGEVPWWNQTGQAVVRAHRSRIDGSVQPYAVTLPPNYGTPRGRKTYRLDVVLHGRDDSLTEVKFLHQHRGDKAAEEQPFVQIDVFGRGNNAYRWAGETDVLEAVENFLAVETLLGRGALIDRTRVVLRGFSMGGAGTWHLGLHRPSDWCVLGPGAGFTTTHGYVPELAAKLADYEEACLHIYDAVDYAENAANVPVVAYAGAEDGQLQAARNIEAKLKPLGIPMTLLVAPKLGHRFPPEWQKKAEALYAKVVEQGRPAYPKKVHFVTYTLKYPSCAWVELLGLGRHYQRSVVQAERNGSEGFTVKTANVRSLRLGLWPGATRELLTVEIDGQKLERVRPYQQADNNSLHVYLERRAGRWAVALPERLFTERLRVLQKINALQGPIDDAFTNTFLCVKGTGSAWHEATQRYADDNLERFQAEWSKYLRGELPVKTDEEVTPEDITNRNLILFGDPSSNSLIAQVLPGLPLAWTKKQVVWAGKGYDAATHVPALIYPSPLTAEHYVVLNTGHTFRAADFAGTNALLYPRLGDVAVLKLAPTKKDPLAVEVVTAGLFDDYWRATTGR